MDGRGKGERAPVPPALDGFRGLIILCIVFFHVSRWVQWQPQNDVLHALRLDSFFSIDFLFVVTGFLLFLPVVARGALGSDFGEPTWFAIAIPLVFALMMAGTAFTPSWLQWPFANRGVRWLGTVSYGVFLYHIIVLEIVVRVFGFQPDHATSTLLAVLALVVPLSLLLGWLSLKLVEEPGNRRVRALAAEAGRGWRPPASQRAT